MLQDLLGREWNGKYDKKLGSGDLMTVVEFKKQVDNHNFVDDDGHGNPVRGGFAARAIIYPSIVNEIPEGATHIVWYNK